jgi:putative transposase
LLTRQLPTAQVELLAYCLMPNHGHLIVIPHRPESLSRLLRQTHARYARRVNLEHGWQSHLRQERCHSFVMDEEPLFAAARYVELNAVHAGLGKPPDDGPWTSVHSPLHQRADPLIKNGEMRA